MDEDELNALAARVLEKAKLPTLFSYRQAFIEGFKAFEESKGFVAAAETYCREQGWQEPR